MVVMFREKYMHYYEKEKTNNSLSEYVQNWNMLISGSYKTLIT